jgi:hypothetical protein
MLRILTGTDHIAQVLLELACEYHFFLCNYWILQTSFQAAYKLNSDEGFNPQPQVYAILTDLKDFYFFSYDSTHFKMDSEIRVSSATRSQFLSGMGDGPSHHFLP